MEQTQIEKVKEYYNSTLTDYKLFWNSSKNLAMHFGYYDEKVRNHTQSLLKMNEVLVKLVNISSKDKILDAGCGYGGSGIWLARNIGCRVIGLTIVPYQIEKAKEYAEKFNVSDKVDFQNQDYSHTSFPNDSFDVVWGLESIVHTENKENFIKEAFRLLKKKGRIIVAEFMLRDNPPLSNKERDFIKPCLAGWAMPSLLTPKEYKFILEKIGFRNIKIIDITKNVMPSLNRLAKINMLFPIAKILHKIRIINNDRFENMKGSLIFINAFRKGLWRYITITAEKN